MYISKAIHFRMVLKDKCSKIETRSKTFMHYSLTILLKLFLYIYKEVDIADNKHKTYPNVSQCSHSKPKSSYIRL